MDSLLKHESQAGSDIVWPLLQFLCHPAPPTSRAYSRSEVMWLGWGYNPYFGRIVYSQEMASSGYESLFASVLLGIIPVDYWEFPLQEVST